QALDIDNLHPVRREQMMERGERVIAKMLVIDRIELNLVEQVLDVRSLDDADAAGLEDRRNARNKTVQIGHVSQDVVLVKNVGLQALVAAAISRLETEKITLSANGFGARYCGDVSGRLDAQHGNTALSVMFEQVAVVARRFDHEAIGR